MSDMPTGGLGDLFRQAQELQEQLVAAQEEAATQEIEGQAGGGAVKIRLTGSLDVRAVHIDPAAVDPEDVPMLEDLVLAALRDALDQASTLTREAVGGVDLASLLGGAGGGMGGLFGGLFGGDAGDGPLGGDLGGQFGGGIAGAGSPAEIAGGRSEDEDAGPESDGDPPR